MSSSRSIQTETTTLSRLERLPQYLLEIIFLRACNCNLPLLSSTLLAALPPTRPLIQKIGLAMLGSHDAGIQSELLQRRFLNLELYDALATKLKPLDGSHFMLADGVRLCSRLLNNIVTQGQQESTTVATYWKIELLWLLMEGGIDAQDQIVLQELDDLHDAARSGLDEAVGDGNLDAVAFFCGGGVLIHPFMEPLYTAFIEQECANKEIILELMECVLEWSHDSYENENIDDWIDERKEADERRREEEGGDEGTGVWVGKWAEMVWKKRQLISYEEFVSLQEGDGLGSESSDEL